MVETTGPVDGDVALVAVQTGGALHAAAGADAAELEQAVKDRAVISDIVLALLSHKGVHVVGRDLLQELDVLVGVELRHLGRDGRLGPLLLEWQTSSSATRGVHGAALTAGKGERLT